MLTVLPGGAKGRHVGDTLYGPLGRGTVVSIEGDDALVRWDAERVLEAAPANDWDTTVGWLEMALAGTTDPGGVSTPSAAALTGEHADPRGRGGRRVSPTPSSAGFMVRAQGRMAASSSPASWGGARVRVLPDVGRDHSGRRRRMFGPAAARDFRPAR